MEAVQETVQRSGYSAIPLNTAPRLTKEGISRFLTSLEKDSKNAETVKNYARSLDKLYIWLPGGKWLTEETLADWRDTMLSEGCASATVNMRISAANGYLAFLGRRDLQLLNQLKKERAETPELTRAEYLRLLQTARALNDGAGYFIVKLFGDTGIRPQDLPKVTVEAARSGEIELGDDTLHIPDCLQKELLAFAKQQGKTTGPFIAQKDGRPMARTQVNKQIERLCHDAQVPEEKASPKCLRQLYRQTYGDIEANIAVLIRQTYDHLLEAEQASIGWGLR